MALDLKPATWIPNWSEDGTNVTIPIASIPELTAAEADAVTGDMRKCLFAFLMKVYASWLAMAAEDRPANMTLSRNPSFNDADGSITWQFVATFKVEVLSQDVVDEPA